MLKLNVDSADRTVVVPNQLFVSMVASVSTCVGAQWWQLLVSDPIQERSRAAKYQVSPDLQLVLFAFDVKAVSGAAGVAPPLSLFLITS